MLYEVPGVKLQPDSIELLVKSDWIPFNVITYDENTPYSLRMRGKAESQDGKELDAAVYWYKVFIKDNIPTSLLSYVDENNQRLAAPAHGRIEIT